MNSMQYFEKLKEQLVMWRRDFHQHPETAYEEFRTSSLIEKRLKSFGLNVVTGLAETGVVATISNGNGPMIGLRADMDALNINELNTFSYRSQHQGKMHACGHDGHSTMLLGAAKYLAKNKNFTGTVCFIFQPAEEDEAGAKKMIEDGLFEQFPCKAVYGMHNWPGLEVGKFAARVGSQMAAFDTFEIIVTGNGLHSSMPHKGTDSIVSAAHLATAIQSLISRDIDPHDTAVVSLTQVHGGNTWNSIPEEVTLRGSVRSLKPEIQDIIEKRINELCKGVAQTYGTKVIVNYQRRYPATINTEIETMIARKAAESIVKKENVLTDFPSAMASEDFGFITQEKPGCYIWIGNGLGENGCTLHNGNYDFNDDILPIGASYWVNLIEKSLPKHGK